jgi:hypothetical protein
MVLTSTYKWYVCTLGSKLHFGTTRYWALTDNLLTAAVERIYYMSSVFLRHLLASTKSLVSFNEYYLQGNLN